MAEFLRQASLNGAKGALAAPAGLRRAGQDLADAQGAQGLAHLTALLLGQLTGRAVLAEVAGPVGVEFAKTAVIAHHRLQRSKGRGGPLLGEETSVQNAAVGIVQRDHQLLARQPWNPL